MTKEKNSQRDAIRSTMDMLLNDLPDQIDNISQSDVNELVRPKRDEMKYANLKGTSEKKAKSVINSILKFYVNEDIIAHEEYVRAKVELDNMSLTNLIYLMDTSEKAINSLLEEILDNGDKQPRMYEVLAMLQKTQLDILKSQNVYIISMEESFKRMSKDIEIYSGHSSGTKKQVKKDTVSARGTKDLMKAIRGISAEEEEEENSRIQNIELEE